MKGTSTFISGWASHHPDGRRTNDDLVATIDTTHEWLESHLGIIERRIASADASLADLCEPSATEALRRAGVGADQLDFIIGTASGDDMQIPNAAARVGDRIEAAEAHAIDVKAACSGWFTGLELADAFLQTGRAERMLVVAGELSRDCVDPTDRLSVIYFGDGSAAGVVSQERPAVGLEVLDFERQSNNHLHHAVEIPTIGSFRTDARATRAWVEEAIAAVADRLLKRHDLTSADLRALVCHQANLRLIEYVADQLGVEEERHWHNVEWAGNTGAVGAPSALFEGIDRNIDNLRDGDLILVVTVGSGLNAVGVLLRWVSDQG